MSNSKNLKTIVIGGTGKVGEELIEELLNSPDVKRDLEKTDN